MRTERAARDIVTRPGSSVPGPPCVANGLVPGLKGPAGFGETASNCDFAASGEMDKQGDTVCARADAAKTKKSARAFNFPSCYAVIAATPRVPISKRPLRSFQYLPCPRKGSPVTGGPNRTTARHTAQTHGFHLRVCWVRRQLLRAEGLARYGAPAQSNADAFPRPRLNW